MRRQESISHGPVVEREGREEIKRQDKTEGPVSVNSKQPRLFKKKKTMKKKLFFMYYSGAFPVFWSAFICVSVCVSECYSHIMS